VPKPSVGTVQAAPPAVGEATASALGARGAAGEPPRALLPRPAAAPEPTQVLALSLPALILAALARRHHHLAAPAPSERGGCGRRQPQL